jgi:hypothetical protein
VKQAMGFLKRTKISIFEKNERMEKVGWKLKPE